LDVLVHEEGLRHRGGIRETRGLDNDPIKQLHPLGQLLKCLHQVTPHRAADAPVHHLDDLLIDLLFRVWVDDLLVDPHLAELILNDGEAHAMVAGEQVV